MLTDTLLACAHADINSLMKSILPIVVFAIGLLDYCAAVSIVEQQIEYIRYFDPERPPVVETYVKDETKHWRLRDVQFDSDGDWALDMIMHFLDPESRKFTAEELETLRKQDEETHSVRKDGVLLQPLADDYKNKARLYRKADLQKALEADASFRMPLLSGTTRQLSVPTPEATENKQRRESVAYRDLLKRLTDLKIAAPPAVPKRD